MFVSVRCLRTLLTSDEDLDGYGLIQHVRRKPETSERYWNLMRSLLILIVCQGLPLSSWSQQRKVKSREWKVS